MAIRDDHSTSEGSDVGADLLVRPRLVARLRDGSGHPLTVLTAPAGYGKSVAIDQWATEHRGRPVARVEFRRTDDGSRAAARLTAALSQLGAASSAASLAHLSDSGRSLGTRFVDDLEDQLASAAGGILVLDALDAPRHVELISELAMLAERVSAKLHVLVTRRSRWTGTRPRLDGRERVLTLDEHELAFTHEEAWLLVRQVSGRELTDDQVARLLARTEGWGVGLHLAAIGLRRAPDRDAYIDGFSGEDRHVAAFLLGEVLAGQPPFVRQFLAQTSVLDRLSGSLSDALTRDVDGSAMLRRLEDGAVFTRRLPDAEGWFIYHPMFRHLLRRELRLGDPEAESRLLARAAAWHATRGDLEAAAGYLIEAEDWTRLLELADTHGRTMFEEGREHELRRWLEAIAASAEPSDCELELRRAYVLTVLGQTPQAAQILHSVEKRERSCGQQLVIDALRSTWGYVDAPMEATMRAANEARRSLDRVEAAQIPDIFGITAPTSLSMMVEASGARALWYSGDVTSSRRAFAELVRRRADYAPWHARVLSALALLEAWAGNLRVARTHAARASRVATDRGLLQHPAMLDARIAGAHILRERGDLRRSAQLLDETLTIAERTRRPITMGIYTVERALWHLAGGQPEDGLLAIERHRATGEPPLPTLVDSWLHAVEMRLLLSMDHMDRAEAILSELTHWPRSSELAAAAVEAAILRRDVATARARLDRWSRDRETEPRGRLLHGFWTAVVDFETGSRRTGLTRASAVLKAAEPEGHIRLFLDGGSAVERLLRTLLHASPTPYVRRIMRSPRPAPVTGSAVLGLSKRELEVIRYLPTPLTSAEIAEHLYISLNTLKTHLRTIYKKLGVRGRREAIQRAQGLGIA